MFEFEEKDFEDAYGVGDDGGDELYMHLIVRAANAKLEAWLTAAPAVFSCYHEPGWHDAPECTKRTHKAKLVQIEPLDGSKEPESV